MMNKNIYALEYSRWSDKNRKFPYHVQPLIDVIKDNRRLHDHEPDNQNMWTIIFCGTQSECFELLESIT